VATMRKGEREELAKHARQRAALARKMAEQRAAELRADAERQLATMYQDEDERFRDLTATAKAACRKADETLAKRCRELGIPEEMRPSINYYFSSRGENSVPARRTELRRVLMSRVEAMTREAYVRIEAGALEAQTMLLRDGLESAQAHAFLDAMPTIEALMPKIDVVQLTHAAWAGPDEDPGAVDRAMIEDLNPRSRFS
jgi:hypothetical protein